MKTKDLKQSVTEAVTKITKLKFTDDSFAETITNILCDVYSDGAEHGFSRGYEQATNLTLKTLQEL